jgi:hypothetical protein
VGQKRSRQKRHVAGYHQHLFRRRFDERRIQTTQRSGPCDAIRHNRHPGGLFVRRVAADNQDMRGNRAEHRELPAEDRRGADGQSALVASAETPRPGASHYCC